MEHPPGERVSCNPRPAHFYKKKKIRSDHFRCDLSGALCGQSWMGPALPACGPNFRLLPKNAHPGASSPRRGIVADGPWLGPRPLEPPPNEMGDLLFCRHRAPSMIRWIGLASGADAPLQLGAVIASRLGLFSASNVLSSVRHPALANDPVSYARRPDRLGPARFGPQWRLCNPSAWRSSALVTGVVGAVTSAAAGHLVVSRAPIFTVAGRNWPFA